MTRAAPPSAHRPSPTVIHVCPRCIRPLLPPFSPVLSGAAAREHRVPRDRSRPWRDFTGHFAPSSPLRTQSVLVRQRRIYAACRRGRAIAHL